MTYQSDFTLPSELLEQIASQVFEEFSMSIGWIFIALPLFKCILCVYLLQLRNIDFIMNLSN
jgi:hypothetical protein